MSKYEPLRQFLAERAEGEWRATFATIEDVLGFPLCPAARKHRAWWANSISQAGARSGWLAAGWKTVDVDLGGERLVFVRQR